MKPKLPTVLILAGLMGGALVSPRAVPPADAPKSSLPDIYDETADANKQIADAVAQAKKENKRVLLQFGANWCGWCHKLHKLFDTDKAVGDKLKAGYVVALIDVNKGHNKDLITKYEAQKMGLPFIVILGSDGQHLTTKNSGELEEGDHHSPQKVIAFLDQWTPKK